MIKVICIGKIKEKYLTDLIEDYIKRINKYHKLEIVEFKDNNIEKESEEILNHLSEKDYLVCMDINGEKYNSVMFSKFIDDTFSRVNSNITFIIGGSDGVTQKVKDMCNKKISFSDMTFPHGLFRGILLEQIYRSFKIINNEKYHK